MTMRYALALAGCIFSAAFTGAAHAGSIEIVVENAWSRASIGTARPGVAYMTIVNQGDDTATLTGLRSEIARMPQIHRTTTNDQGISSMSPADGIEIAPGEEVVLEPGGLHVMMMGLHRAMKPGDAHELVLVFADDDTITVVVPVLGIGARGPQD